MTRCKVRMNRVAEHRSINDSATCEITRAFRPKVRPRQPWAEPLFSAGTRSVLELCKAGTKPKNTALTTAAIKLKINTRWSNCTSREIGRSLANRNDEKYSAPY